MNIMENQIAEQQEIQETESTEIVDNITNEKLVFTQQQFDDMKQELNDKFIRLFAEFENYKKRAAKEKEDLRSVVKMSMLDVILDLDNDLSIAKRNTTDPGIDLIISKVEKFLQTQGVEVIQTETYDVDLHEVISTLEVGEQKIIDVASKGYMLNGKPHRYPKIVLGK